MSKSYCIGWGYYNGPVDAFDRSFPMFLGDFTEVDGTVGTFFGISRLTTTASSICAPRRNRFAWLRARWTDWKNMFSFEIYGRTLKLHIEGLGSSYGTERLTFYRMLPEMGPPEMTTWEFPFPDTSWERELAELLPAIKQGRPPIGNIHGAKANLDIVDKLYQK